MKTIKFNDKELEFISQMYKEELAEAKKYVDQIQELLKKLGARPAKMDLVEKELKPAKKKGAKAAKKAVEKKEPKKRGRKPGLVIPAVEDAIAALKLPKKEEKKKAEKKKTKATKKVVKKKTGQKRTTRGLVTATPPRKPPVRKQPVAGVAPTVESKTEPKE